MLWYRKEVSDMPQSSEIFLLQSIYSVHTYVTSAKVSIWFDFTIAWPLCHLFPGIFCPANLRICVTNPFICVALTIPFPCIIEESESRSNLDLGSYLIEFIFSPSFPALIPSHFFQYLPAPDQFAKLSEFKQEYEALAEPEKFVLSLANIKR